ncbi:MAG: tRNA 2-thiouridine(34) synthase MnmA [Bacteroidales bacterium]|nr:tRNA 2-thiouridine(34) synthase MnmA [Bacteroidales bacterium]
MNIAALVSGGVDSSVAIPILIEQGFRPVIFYIKIAMEDEPGYLDCPSEEDIEITSWIARKYGLEMEIVDLQKEYWERVVSYTIETVKQGLTPNPDVMCNRLIKFGSFEDRFGKDFDKIATGHYASVIEDSGQFYLGTARDRIKDQSYFLGRITYSQLSKTMFPLHDMLKKEVRSMAEKMKLPSAHRPDSQGICFLGKINYNDFIRKYVGEKPGEIIELETGKAWGEHKGLWFHTIGQRKGLGLSQGPWFVVKKDLKKNILYISNGYDPVAQYSKKIVLSDFRFINENKSPALETPLNITFKIRHQPEFSKGILQKSENLHIIDAKEAISGVAPGQFGVVYDADMHICLGSGIIT